MQGLEEQKNGVTFWGRETTEGLVELSGHELAGLLEGQTLEHLSAHRTHRDHGGAGAGLESGHHDMPILDMKSQLKVVTTFSVVRFSLAIGGLQGTTIEGLSVVLPDGR